MRDNRLKNRKRSVKMPLRSLESCKWPLSRPEMILKCFARGDSYQPQRQRGECSYPPHRKFEQARRRFPPPASLFPLFIDGQFAAAFHVYSHYGRRILGRHLYGTLSRFGPLRYGTGNCPRCRIPSNVLLQPDRG